MTTKEFVEIENRLLPHLPGFRVTRSLMVLQPLRYLIRGIDFERSSDRDSFYVWKFVLPLCVPHEFISFEFGDRVRDSRNRDGWYRSAPDLIDELAACLNAEAVPYLTSVGSLLDFVNLAVERSPLDPHVYRSLAFCLARAGCIDESVAFLDQTLPQIRPTYPWETAIFEMCLGLKAQLIADPESAQAQLAAWESETVRNLKLEEFWMGP